MQSAEHVYKWIDITTKIHYSPVLLILSIYIIQELEKMFIKQKKAVLKEV